MINEKKLLELVKLGVQKKIKNNRHTYRRLYKNNNNNNTGCCVVCGENRCVENCHIIPFVVCLLIDGYRELSYSPKNNIRLCKNHHWLFDNRKLSDDELVLIHKDKKDFIDNELLDIANSKIIQKDNINITNQELLNINKFIKFIDWVAKIFYIKND